MNKDFIKRLEKLEHIMILESFIVVYKDGYREQIPPGECILLCKSEKIKAFEGSSSKENGKLIELLNGLLEEREE